MLTEDLNILLQCYELLQILLNLLAVIVRVLNWWDSSQKIDFWQLILSDYSSQETLKQNAKQNLSERVI